MMILRFCFMKGIDAGLPHCSFRTFAERPSYSILYVTLLEHGLLDCLHTSCLHVSILREQQTTFTAPTTAPLHFTLTYTSCIYICIVVRRIAQHVSTCFLCSAVCALCVAWQLRQSFLSFAWWEQEKHHYVLVHWHGWQKLLSCLNYLILS